MEPDSTPPSVKCGAGTPSVLGLVQGGGVTGAFSEYLILCTTFLSQLDNTGKMEDGSRTCAVWGVGSQQLLRQDDESNTALIAIEFFRLIQASLS